MLRDYVVFDIETANSSYASICQIAWADVRRGEIVDAERVLIDPLCDFDRANIEIHGINAARIRGAPTFANVLPRIRPVFDGRYAIHHGSFDRSSLNQACEMCGAEAPHAEWVDSTVLVRRVWPEYAKRGFGLRNVASALGIQFNHHDALEDALALHRIIETILDQTGLGLDALVRRVFENPKRPSVQSSKITAGGVPNGRFTGQQIVFTGSLSVTRNEAAAKAAGAGFDVASKVTRRTTYLCVGGAGDPENKSGKLQHAEILIAKGIPLRIISEEEFWALTTFGPQHAQNSST